MSFSSQSSLARAALSPKSSNRPSSSYLKLLNAFRTSPLKHKYIKETDSNKHSSPVPLKQQKLAFSIFEDKESAARYNAYTCSPLYKPNHDDHENILQVNKEFSISARNGIRIPLNPLLANMFPGFISKGSGDSLGPAVELMEPFRPLNANNGFGSLHKHSAIAADLTPVKRATPYMVSSSIDVYLEKIGGSACLGHESEFEINKMHESELTSPRKVHRPEKRSSEVRLKNGYLHVRSLLAGTNDSKLPLIKRNSFEIMSRV